MGGAQQVQNTATQQTLLGTGVGTLLGAGFGAAMGGGKGAAIGAGAGAIGGTMVGAAVAQANLRAAQQRYDTAYAQCMNAQANPVPNFAPATNVVSTPAQPAPVPGNL